MNNKTTKVLGMLVILMGLGAVGVWAATSQDATITVTPITTVAMTIAPTTYAYGNLALNTSSVTASALVIQDTGTVNIAIKDQVTGTGGWSTTGTSVSTDTFVLYVATAAVMPSSSTFTTSPDQRMISSGQRNLLGLGGGSPVLDTSGGATSQINLWFRLDMPTAVSSGVGQTLKVTFTGVAQ